MTSQQHLTGTPEGFAFKTNEGSTPETFLPNNRELLRLVCETVKLYASPVANTTQSPAYLPMSQLYRQIAAAGDETLAQECEWLLDRVLNLFQTGYADRKIHIAAILEHAAALDARLPN